MPKPRIAQLLRLMHVVDCDIAVDQIESDFGPRRVDYSYLEQGGGGVFGDLEGVGEGGRVPLVGVED